jgi:hypothetical protein
MGENSSGFRKFCVYWLREKAVSLMNVTLIRRQRMEMGEKTVRTDGR